MTRLPSLIAPFDARVRAEMRFVALWLLAPAVLLLAAIGVVCSVTRYEFWRFSVDLAALVDTNPLFGMLSTLGVMTWCAAAVVCLLTWRLLRDRGVVGEVPAFFLLGGLGTTVLMLDDQFMFHDRLAGRYLGLNENLIYAVYAIGAVSYLVRFRRIVLGRNPLLFFLAVGLLATSIFFDSVDVPFHWAFEDTPKFLGIVAWLGWFWTMSRRELLPVPPTTGV
jgi:hypothetical protein